MIGKTLGHYQITEKLGAGGMGVVYKAHDTHLDRFAALKVLPPETVADAGRKQRFVQEARAASALNHPNIVHIYDISSTDGVDYIAMEFVPGKTVDGFIGRKGMPVKDALACAIQIADALGTAHAAGIIHRDIKPSNIMLMDDGRVKILDFGLAKLVERESGSGDAETRSTTPAAITGAGQIVGTIAYMSPEQATGGQLDARSDIFSFGAMLYEMVSGRRPFTGDTGPSTFAAILAKEPASPSSIVGELPFELERAVLRCLRKEPQRRWQTMADLKVALQELKDELDSGKVSGVIPAATRPARHSWILAGALGLILAAAAAGWWFWRPREAPVSYEAERLTFDGAAALSPAISPDGNLIAYASDRAGSFSLYLKQFGARQAIPLTGPESRDWYPSFSPDGLRLVFRSEREGGGLYIRDVLGGPGGAEMKLADRGQMARFSPDGSTIAYLVSDAMTASAKLFVISAGSGTPRPIQPDFVMVPPSIAGGNQAPLWSPDGANILFRGARAGDPTTRGWWVTPVSGGVVEAIQAVPAEPQWFARYAIAWRGEYIYYIEGEPINGMTLYRLRITSQPWRTAGAPEKLGSFAGITLGASISSNGRMVFASLALTTNIWSASLQAGKGTVSGKLERVTTDSNGKMNLTVAADGSRLAYTSYGPPTQHNVEVRLKEMTTGRESLIAGSGKSPFLFPILSPDGSKLAYRDRPERKFLTYVADGGSTSARVVCESCIVHAFFRGAAEALVETDGRLVRRSLDGGSQVVLAQSPSFFGDVALSPDGRRLAFTHPGRDGAAALYLADITHPPIPADSWRLVDEDRNHIGSPRWSTDGKLLYYVSQRDGSPCVWALPVADDGKPSGPAMAVLHLHSGNAVQARVTQIGVTNDRLFLLLTEYKGEILAVNLER